MRKNPQKQTPVGPVPVAKPAARKAKVKGAEITIPTVAAVNLAVSPTPKKSPSSQSGPTKTPARKKTAAAAGLSVVTASPDQAIAVYQIYFEAGQRAGLDPDWIPFDNAGPDDRLREFAVFERLAKDEGVRLATLWGAMSWRFGSKTGLNGKALRKVIEEHPGCDVYYCNPFPEHEALFTSGWQQGITAHPAFLELCGAVFKASGLDPRVLKAVQPSQAFSACNYFVASPAFWSSYLPWVREHIERARAKLPSNVLNVLDSHQSDPRKLHAGSTYWPFIIERLLGLYLRSAGKELKVHKYALPAAEARLNTHLQRLREMKDVAHRSRSPWLFACWLNYRNLYLLQTSGSDWCKRYLPLISPTEVDFW